MRKQRSTGRVPVGAWRILPGLEGYGAADAGGVLGGRGERVACSSSPLHRFVSGRMQGRLRN